MAAGLEALVYVLEKSDWGRKMVEHVRAYYNVQRFGAKWQIRSVCADIHPMVRDDFSDRDFGLNELPREPRSCSYIDDNIIAFYIFIHPCVSVVEQQPKVIIFFGQKSVARSLQISFGFHSILEMARKIRSWK
jgi:hypothetical protein